MPPADRPVGDFIGYHVRTGEHDVTAYDWEQYQDNRILSADFPRVSQLRNSEIEPRRYC